MTAYGADLKQLFANTARGLFSLITGLDAIAVKEKHKIQVNAPDREALLVNWLNELIYLCEVKGYCSTGLISLFSQIPGLKLLVMVKKST